MRVIKFRAWDSHNKVMITPYAELKGGRFWGEDLTNTGYAEPLPEHVMQFSGLTDKSGKEIYEGDRIRYIGGEIERGEGVIEFNCGFNIWWDLSTVKSTKPSVASPLWYFQCSAELEVIGNIHEGIK